MQMRHLLLLGATALITTSGLQAQSTFNPTTPAFGFNVFTKSAVRFSAGDTHGPVATGGDAILQGNTIVSMNYDGYYPNGKDNSANYGLVIGGRVWYNSGNQTQLNRGQLRIGSLTGTSLYNVNSSSTQTQVQLSPGAFNTAPNIQSNSSMPLNSATAGNGLNFTTAFAAMAAYSIDINSFPTTQAGNSGLNFLSVPPTTGGGSQTITLAAGKVNYMNLTAAESTAMGNSGITYTFSRPLDSSTVVVFNVTATGSYQWIPASFGGISDNSMGEGRYILYNFPTASRIEISGSRSTIGSILAPDAAVYKTGGNNAAGTIIADTFSLQYGEVHYAPFGGSLPGTSIALPVELLGLGGAVRQGTVTLAWNAKGLGNGASLDLERSEDGSRFEKIASLPASESGSWEDRPASGTQRAFYRLRANAGNEIKYSAVWRADFQQQPAVAAGPNPFTNKIEIRAAGTFSWELSDLRGATVRKGSCEGACAIPELAAMPVGSYLLRVNQSGVIATQQLIKQ
jgi:choice-of-anchor A domain-containing protein